MFTLHQKFCKRTKYWAHPPIQLRQTRHTKTWSRGNSNSPALHYAECNITLCVLHVSTENWDSLAPLQCVAANAKARPPSVEEGYPSSGPRGSSQPPEGPPLVLLGLPQLGRRHDVLALVSLLGALLPCLHVEDKTSIKHSLTYTKKYICIKNKKTN